MRQGIYLSAAFLDWPWYDEPVTKAVFLHLLLCAEHGKAACSRQSLASALGISEQQTRTALARLTKLGEIAVTTTNQGMAVILPHYETYLRGGQRSDQQSTNESASKSTNESTKKSTNKSTSEKSVNNELDADSAARGRQQLTNGSTSKSTSESTSESTSSGKIGKLKIREHAAASFSDQIKIKDNINNNINNINNIPPPEGEGCRGGGGQSSGEAAAVLGKSFVEQPVFSPSQKKAGRPNLSACCARIDELTPSEKVREAAKAWVRMRFEKGARHRPSLAAIDRAFVMIRRWGYSEDKAAEVFERSMISNWDGVFEIK